MEALGRNHAFESALADIVDNSIDAGADNTLIRFVRRGERLISLLIVDDGRGMNERQLDVAMTVGGTRKYGPNDLGRFGLGLKAASFSQARGLTVVSRAARHQPCGRPSIERGVFVGRGGVISRQGSRWAAVAAPRP